MTPAGPHQAPDRRRPAGHKQDAGYSVDPNAAAKTTVSTALGEVPEVGFLLSGLVDIFWPDGQNDVWNSIESRVEALINQKLSDYVYAQTQSALTGLKNALELYNEYARPGHTGQETAAHWAATETVFVDQIPILRTAGYERLQLPLWTQAANMHLGLLREGVLSGKDWGWNQADTDTAYTDLKKAIADYTAWAPRIFGFGMASALGPADYHRCQPFRSGNDYRSQMIPAVLDMAARWPYFDPIAYPPPVPAEKLYLDREIYTDPVGTADDSGLLMLPWAHPTQPISQITVWSGTLIDAVQVSYPPGGGPDQVTQTVRMGSPSGGNASIVTVSSGNPVTGVSVWAGDVVQGLQFSFKDGTNSPRFGNTSGEPSARYSLYDEDDQGNKTYQILSSVYVSGMSRYYSCADAIVFGFQYERPS
jgi:hypothetical protein